MRASDRAYRALREDIVSGRLPPGTVLAEVEQSQRLGISRTPLREAISRLTADGLAAPHTGRGVVVTAISPNTVTELFELRQALECKAASLAASRGNPEVFTGLRREFEEAADLILQDAGTDPSRAGYYALVARLDEAIDTAAANTYLTQALANVRLHLARVRRLAKDNPERLLATAGEHATIAAAIAARDPALAASATSVHLHKSLEHFLAATGPPD
ncbi:GntR family transcriptional regulator [Arthrobacter sp. zg-Y820]|uniref:GntR family transcriptional regulator n=1 Tax=unclassified Arthrobacter TaxID=235627 RepID=UPI001E4087E9|nr:MULTISPECIES: GntR family transcriptional regulator [unclassified Arthrobacter]MCC9197926.1 GntR family transcriptional regulator [Arthrobacter sp. zg-Y820]MDK1280793.1 GntR family transcriptional regulator [Arthrobacter sp. zg.Y820]MDK1360865.1 GntR family transcriptional regulator [Arthrobacter sp. zg-Y1219]WIB10583.1 GntR family transcriptional regulator [Arthrobacter sp. zg-Y820]